MYSEHSALWKLWHSPATFLLLRPATSPQTTAMMLVELLRKHEGLRLVPYLCPAGHWTIGIGHRCEEKQPPITREDAERILADDIARARLKVRELVKVDLKPHQEDAMTSFVFNVGTTKFKDSILLALLNRGAFDLVPEQMRRWVYAGDKVLPGLVSRREDEARLFAGFGFEVSAA